MTPIPPEDRDSPRFRSGHAEEGRVAAVIGWALYILSIPSANVLVLVGLLVAYAGRARPTQRGIGLDMEYHPRVSLHRIVRKHGANLPFGVGEALLEALMGENVAEIGHAGPPGTMSAR